MKLGSEEQFKQYLESLRKNSRVRILVGYATCGISAGADKVYEKLMQINDLGVEVKKVGCLGICRLEPIVEIYDEDGTRTTYVEVDTSRMESIYNSHIRKGEVQVEYTIGLND